MNGGSSPKLSRSMRTNEMPNNYGSEVDTDKKSDAGTTNVQFNDDDGDAFSSDYSNDYDQFFDETLYGGPIKEKLEALAMLVGADCSEPEDVLTKAINILEDLEKEKAELLEILKHAEPKK